MSRPELPLGEGNVPDKALEELLQAFAVEPPQNDEIDVDDPSIDLLLGLDDEPAPHDASVLPTTEQPVSTVEQPLTVLAKAATRADEPVEDSTPPAGVEAEAAPAEEPPKASTRRSRRAEAKQAKVAAKKAGKAEGDKAETAVAATAATAGGARKPIQIGGDDGLPDPVYLDEEGEERLRGTSGRATEASIREERTTILIGGDEVEGSSGGIPLATGNMDPRLRARRIAVSREATRRRLKWVLVPVVIVVVVATVLALLGSSLFAVRDISVSGAARIDQRDLDAALKELKGKAVLLVDTHAVESRLEKSPWVQDARVSTDFPHSASIEIRERQPLATYQGPDGKYRIIDVEGRVVAVLDGQPIEFMLVKGPAVNAEAGGSAGTAFTHAAELIEALTPGVRSRTEEVDLSDTGELSLVFHNDPGTVVVLGAPNQLLDKLTRLEALLKNTDVDKCTRVDVSTAELGPTCTS